MARLLVLCTFAAMVACAMAAVQQTINRASGPRVGGSSVGVGGARPGAGWVGYPGGGWGGWGYPGGWGGWGGYPGGWGSWGWGAYPGGSGSWGLGQQQQQQQQRA
uniref:Glycine rich superfamily member n=1 Tax=Rhipicephalus appendiculatus TaxID=34631 RepID=A0A131YD19_RHIAP